MVYKFEISQPDGADFRCVIAMDCEQTFQQFHDKLIDVLDFDGSQIASFFTLDRDGNRVREIALLDMSEEMKEDKSDEDEEVAPLLLMSKTKIGDIINANCIELDYVYDFFSNSSIRIAYDGEYKPKKSDIFPLCLLCEGDLPDQPDFESDDDAAWKFAGSHDDDYDDDFMKEFSHDDDDFRGGFGDEEDDNFGEEGGSYSDGEEDDYGRGGGGRYESIDDYIDRL